MPVSFTPATHPANSVQASSLVPITSPDLILQRLSYRLHRKSDEILQSSFSNHNVNKNILPRSNGFVHAVVDAYNEHYALDIRPDDVWLAILTQFNFFVNGNAELLRSKFVNHTGKKELVIKMVGTRYTVDFGYMARTMTDLMQANIVDPTLQEWILPKFSTTTIHDTTVGAAVMMAAMKEYFSYMCELTCGIPHVTLQGEKGDWEMILARLEKLKEYGLETTAWYHLLVPVISRFVRAFDDPDGAENIEFWQKVAHVKRLGSGSPRLSGWINAFCVFDVRGRWMGTPFKPPSSRIPVDFTSLSASEFQSIYARIKQPSGNADKTGGRQQSTNLILDGAQYHTIKNTSIPSAFAEVDIKLDDNGQMFDTVLVAGLVGMGFSRGEGGQHDPLDGGDTVTPVSGWWIFTKKPGNEERGSEF